MLLAAQLSGLALLFLLVCPISMGAMMLFMGKGMMGGHKGTKAPPETSSLAELRAEQSRLAEMIDKLDADDPAAESQAPQSTTAA